MALFFRGGDSGKVEICFAYILLYVNCIYPIWMHMGERGNIVCVWVGGVIESERVRYQERDIEQRENYTRKEER